MVLEKTLESPLDSKEIKPVNLKGNLNTHWKDWRWSWSSNTLATWCEEPTHWKNPWCWQRLRTGGEESDRGWDEWDEMVEWDHRWVWVLGDSEGQGSLVCCSPRGLKESDMTCRLNNNNKILEEAGDSSRLTFLQLNFSAFYRCRNWKKGYRSSSVRPGVVQTAPDWSKIHNKASKSPGEQPEFSVSPRGWGRRLSPTHNQQGISFPEPTNEPRTQASALSWLKLPGAWLTHCSLTSAGLSLSLSLKGPLSLIPQPHRQNRRTFASVALRSGMKFGEQGS